MKYSRGFTKSLMTLLAVLLVAGFLAVPAVPAGAAVPVALDDEYRVTGGDTLTVSADHAFYSAWGTLGSDDGQFNLPHGVAVNDGGYVYVADYYNQRIQKFSANGTYVAQWNTARPGDAFASYPYGIALDGAGNVFVTDRQNERVEKFTVDGTYVTQWGTAGSGDGQFDYPAGLAVDDDGYVYVADTGNSRIQKFTSDGAFVAKWGVIGGSGNGQFLSPLGIAVGGDGYVYVADSGNDRVQKLDTNGTYVAQWGSTGSGNGQFQSPVGIAISDDGYVYVTDTTDNRVQRFTTEGTYVSQWGAGGSGDGEFQSPTGIAIDPDGYAYVTDSANHRVQKLTPPGVLGNDTDTDGDTLTASLRSGPAHGTLTLHGDGAFTYTPSLGYDGPDSFTYTAWDGGAESNEATVRITVDPDPNVAPVARDDAYVAMGGGTLVQSADHVYDIEWGSLGSGAGEFSFLDGIAVDDSGFVYVADTGNDRVQKFTADGTYVTQWGSNGSGDGQFNDPHGIAVDGNGYVYVADTWNHRVQKFTSGGTYVTQWGSEGSADGQLQLPFGIAVGSGNHVYVADRDNHRIQKFTANGTFEAKWGTLGTGEGEFNYPRGVAADGDGYLYVNNEGDDRILKFTADGTYVTEWGSQGTGDGQFDIPWAVATDKDAFVYVADFFNYRVQKFTSDGTYATEWGSQGTGDGQFAHPAGIAVASDGYVYVTDDGNRRVQRFTPAGVLGNDTDTDGDLFAAVLVTAPSHGTLTLETDGSFTYTPELGFHGADSFTYTAADDLATSVEATVTITVLKGPNNPPAAVDDQYVTPDGSQLAVTAPGVLGNDVDVDIDDALTAAMQNQPAHGQLTLAADGSFQYTPDAGFVGTDTFMYTVSDGEASDTATVAVIVYTADPFTDDDGSIFEADIEWLAAVGITRGCNPPLNTMFCPNDVVTRGQMAAFLVRALGYDDDGGGDLFNDDDSSIFEADIDRLGTAGVTRGCNPPLNTMFCPNDVVTREQMAAFLHRALTP